MTTNEPLRLKFSIGGSHRLYKRQHELMDKQGLKGTGGYSAALGSKRRVWYIECAPEQRETTIAFMRSIGATVAKR